MNNLRKSLLILFVTMAAVFAPSAMNAQSGSWSDESNRDTQWGSDYETATVFSINSHEQLAQFAYMVNEGNNFNGKTVILNDAEEEGWGGQVWTYDYYDMRDYSWVPVGTADNPFLGTFNGNGKEIYLSIDDEQATYQGFFGYIGSNGSVINTTVRSSEITAASQVGAIAGYNGGTMTNCVVTDNTIAGTSYAGAIVGQNAGTMTTCYAIEVNVPAIGGATSSSDITGQGERLWKITGSNIEASVGTPTGTTVGDAEFYDDGIQFIYYHYYKTGATATLTYTKPGYDATFSIESGEGASISGNVVTMGTSDVTVVATTTVAEWTGSGDSADDPYIIYTREQFDMLAERVNDGTSTYQGKFFRLDDYITYGTLSPFYYTPIGNATHPFCGTFDGNGNQISYAGSTDGTSSYQGIFGHIGAGGTVKNLQAKFCSFRGHDYIGVIAGYNAGTIQNCRVGYESNYGGNVTFTEDGHSCYGTIAGYNSGTVSECISYGVVAPSNDINEYTNVTKCGGIVGHNTSTGTVQNCLFLGSNVIGTAYVGAIVGCNEGTLTDNYYHDNGEVDNGNVASGTVKGIGTTDNISGSDNDNAKIAKVVKLSEGGTYSQPYGIGLNDLPTSVTTNNPNERPFYIYEDGVRFNDDYLDDIYGDSYYTTATTIKLTATNVPEGFEASFSTESVGASIVGNTLTLGEDSDVVEVTVSAERIPTGWLADGVRAESFSNTGENSITIMSAQELALLAYNVNFEEMTYEGYTITLGANINLAGNTWEPIGLTSGSGGMGGYPSMGGSASGFLGIFDGASHTISNMNTGNYGTGLFATVSSTVQNLTIENATVSGTSMVGIVAGSCSGIIQNCRVVGGSVSFATSEVGYYMYLGGIVGICSGGTITGCSVDGTTINANVNGEMIRGIGGIVGVLSGSYYDGSGATLTNNIFSGNITLGTGAEYYGAIAGISQDANTPNTIANNYYTTGTIGGINNADVTEDNGAVPGITHVVNGYSGNDGWNLIASPVGAVNVNDVAHLTDNNFDLYAFDQNPSDGMEWVNYIADENGTINENFGDLQPGKGYLYANSEDVTLVFPGTPYNGTGEVTLSKTESAEWSGWNLVGNPFNQTAYITKSFYKMNQDGTALSATTSTGAIEAMEGVFVVADNDNETLTFRTTEPEEQVPALMLNVTQNRGASTSSATIDRAIISFGEENALPKFMLNPKGTKLYIPQGTKDYAIVNAESEGEMPLNFKAEKDGTYTLSFNTEEVNFSYLHLIDNLTGDDVDLLALRQAQGLTTYTFEAKTSDYESRFKLVFNAMEEDDPSTGSGTFAFVSNGEIVITADTFDASLQVIDMTGRVIRTVGLSQCGSRTTTAGMTPGVYVLRLINGDEVKVQKIVVR